MTIEKKTLESLLVRAVHILAQLCCSSKLSNSQHIKVREDLVHVLEELNDQQCKNDEGGLHAQRKKV